AARWAVSSSRRPSLMSIVRLIDLKQRATAREVPPYRDGTATRHIRCGRDITGRESTLATAAAASKARAGNGTKATPEDLEAEIARLREDVARLTDQLA